MAKHSIVVLDNTIKSVDFDIYEVDGIRGTLKELSDYCNVDPVSVSDYLIDGMEFSDAICMADKGFKPAPKPVPKPVPKQGEKRKEESKKSVNTESKDSGKAAIKEKIAAEAVPDKKLAVSVKKLSENKHTGKEMVSTKSVTEVQDLGDIVVITTTTSVVYRK